MAGSPASRALNGLLIYHCEYQMGFADATKKEATCLHAATGGSSTGGFDDRQRPGWSDLISGSKSSIFYRLLILKSLIPQEDLPAKSAIHHSERPDCFILPRIKSLSHNGISNYFSHSWALPLAPDEWERGSYP
ncbi:hypothetical protein HUJ04_011989 [Dendroctonus ponderosae]|nr:hypothetical protein HUJ04_011989 [Dendroctonus ponderosae]